MPNWVTNYLDIRADDSKIQEILKAIKHDEGQLGTFDFNKLIPMPKSLDLVEGTITHESIEAFLSQLAAYVQNNEQLSYSEQSMIAKYFRAASDAFNHSFYTKPNIHLTEKQITESAKKNEMSVTDFLALGKQYLDNQIEYGAATWYAWCTANWETKWNLGAKDCELVNKSVLAFYTPWSSPHPIIEALSKKFPDVEFGLEWADEDLGNNVGTATYKNGEKIDEFVPEPYSKEAYELAFEIECAEAEDFSMVFDEFSGTYVYSEELEEEEDYEEVVSFDHQLEAAKNKCLTEASHGTSQSEKDQER
jgi:hypothetical protein